MSASARSKPASTCGDVEESVGMEVVELNAAAAAAAVPDAVRRDASCQAGGGGGGAVEAVDLRGREWVYRGEGGANLVISLLRDRTVLRFAKSKYAGKKDQDQKVSEIAYFANEVMRPLLGDTFVRPVRIGVVNDDDFETVKLKAQPFRPAVRCKKDINSRRVILSPDCVFLTPAYEAGTAGSTFSVEIKPKQGWHSLKASCSVDLCHRCLKQYAKVDRGEIDNISAYCPLDLFSGDKARMKRALFDLYENPSNRFKIFRDGRLIYTEGTGGVDDLSAAASQLLGLDQNGVIGHPGSPLDMLTALLCSALLSPLEEARAWVVDEDFVSLSPSAAARRVKRDGVAVCDTAGRPLPSGSVLEKLLTLQRHTELSDHGARDLCERLLANIDDLEGLHQIVLWYPNTKLEHQLSCQEIEDVMQLKRFLLSVTAKDVSLLLTFRQVSDGAPVDPRLPTLRFASAGGRRFRVMISVIDLDPKPVHRVSTWVKRKEEWLEAYFKSVGGGGGGERS